MRLRRTIGVLGLALLLTQAAHAQEATGTKPCRIDGIPNELQCGSVKRALDPARPAGVQIDVHYVVVPAMARNKQPDPVLMLAGGPGQSAIDIAPVVLPRLARLNNRRDLVFIDQRGTGRSAPLKCTEDDTLPLAEALDPKGQEQRLQRCLQDLTLLPYGKGRGAESGLRFFTTTIAMQDFEAVRKALGAPQWNLVGASYGTRAALEYLRQFPAQVRRTVIDGVAPPDMVMPVVLSTDSQGALDGMLKACESEAAGCAKQYPQLRAEWAALLKSLPRAVTVNDPRTGLPEPITLTRETVLRSARAPLYVPALEAALPAAIHAAAAGRYDGLIGLGGALGGGGKGGLKLAAGMHFSVICAEDFPRISGATDKPGADYGSFDAAMYDEVCKTWPRGDVPPAFYTIPPAPSPVLVLSGGADPVTPPRQGARAASALGAWAQHIVVPESGHGVLGLPCMRDVLFRFIDAKTDAQALPQEAACAVRIPRPPAFIPVPPIAPVTAAKVSS